MMALRRYKAIKGGWFVLFVLCSVFSLTARADIGVIAQAPLFATSVAPPNIMILIDDSGSMNTSSGTVSRMTAAKQAAINLLDGLHNVRVGIASFGHGWDSRVGATINYGIADLDDNRDAIYAAINALSAGGVTPVAEALHEVGRYFVGFSGPTAPGNQDADSCVANGQYTGNLTLHPGKDLETEKPVNTVLHNTPYLNSGVSGASPICSWCQNNFVIVLTDGAPYYDNDISEASGLRDYDGDCEGNASATVWTIGDPYTAGDYVFQDEKRYLAIADSIGLPGDTEPSARPDLWSHKGSQCYEPCDIKVGKEFYGVTACKFPYTWYPATSGFSDYLDDVAKFLYETDLRPDINDFDGNPAKNNIITYVVGFQLDLDLLEDTALHGGGLYVTANDPEELNDAFTTFAVDIKAKSGTAAKASFSTPSLTTNSAVYLSSFNTSDWSGDLSALALDETTGVPGDELWKATTQLATKQTTDRVMLTHSGANNGDPLGDGVAFRWDNLNSDQQNDLRTNVSGTEESEAAGQARLNYLRGDATNEGAGLMFRTRSSKLGDVINSMAIHIGTPRFSFMETFFDPSHLYSDFREAQKDRTPMVYVGANDGALHGFNANTGEELIAYFPGNLFSSNPNEGYHYLTEETYRHRFYVDGTPYSMDAPIKVSPLGPKDWRTILIGSERAGGRGVFALDVTDPGQFGETNATDLVLWEFNNSHDPHLGKTFSRPVITKMNNGKWAAIFGNGYNDTATGDMAGHAQLFILYLEGGIDGTWDPITGTCGLDQACVSQDYVRITTGQGPRNGLSSPTVIDMDGDGTADRAYAGDVQGNMWAFDLTSTNPSQWLVAETTRGSSTTREWPLFESTSDQPITSKPLVLTHPTVKKTADNTPNYMIYFGTGSLVATGDLATTDPQYYYGIWDRGRALSPANLAEQTVTLVGEARVLDPSLPVGYSSCSKTGGTTPGPVIFLTFGTTGPGAATPVAPSPSSGTDTCGWMIPLPSSGEKVVSDTAFRGDGMLWFSSIVPADTRTCGAGVTSWKWAVQMGNGGSSLSAAFDFDGDGVVGSTGDMAHYTNAATGFDGLAGVAAKQSEGGAATAPSFIGNRRFSCTTGGVGACDDAVVPIKDGHKRLSWIELQPKAD